MTEPNDFNLPLGSRIYRTILKSFNAQARLVVERARGERRADVFYAPAELLRPSDPALIDEADAFIPEFTGIWSKSGKRLYLEIGLDPERWRVVSEALRGAIRDSVLEFAESTQATFRDDLFATYDELKTAIRQDIDAGRLQAGETMPELTKRLMKYFRDTNRARARRIAQTEATRAHHLARERSAKDAGVVVGWEWRATSASCPVCDAIAADSTSPDGLRRVKLGQPFAFIGKKLAYRTIKFPPAHPHCRCTTLPILDAVYSGDPTPIYWSNPFGGTAEKTVLPPADETLSQTIERLRKEWQDAENQFVSVNGSRYIDDKVKMSDRIDRYKVGDAKLDAIVKLAEKFPDHDKLRNPALSQADNVKIQKALAEKGVKENSWGYQRKASQEATKAKADRSHKYLERVRNAAFDVLQVNPENRVRITDQKYKDAISKNPKLQKAYGYKSVIDPELKRRFDTVQSRIFKAVGMPPESNEARIALACIDADIRKVATAHNNSALGVNAFGGARSEDAIAHEIGHAISGNAIEAKGFTKLASYKFDKIMSSDKNLLTELARAVKSEVPDIVATPNPSDLFAFGIEWANMQSQYIKLNYGNGATEVPSVLLESFYHDPITFARRMPRGVTKLLLGFLDGSLR